jgi:hypothetical protein
VDTGVIETLPQARVERYFSRVDPEQHRAEIEERVKGLLAGVPLPDEHAFSAAWYGAHWLVDRRLWEQQTGWSKDQLASALHKYERHLRDEKPERLEVLLGYGVIEGVFTSRAAGEPPRADFLAGAVYGKRDDAVRKVLSRVWAPIKEHAERAGGGELFERREAQRWLMPALPADAWRAVAALVTHWIGEGEHEAFLGRYEIYRERERAVKAARRAAQAESQLAAPLHDAIMAGQELGRIARAHDAFFRAAATFRRLVAVLWDARRGG